MKKEIVWITKTALLLSILIALQVITKPLGQLVTGSCVNLVLAVAALYGGIACGLVVAVISPILAFLFGIAPQILTVPAIILGNSIYVVLLALIGGKRDTSFVSMVIAVACAALAKFLILYGVVAGLICGVFSNNLLDAGLLKQPMLQALPASFGVMQLITALIGGTVSLAIVPVLRRALKK